MDDLRLAAVSPIDPVMGAPSCRLVAGVADPEAAFLDQMAAVQALTCAALELGGLLDLRPGGAGVERVGNRAQKLLLDLIALPREHRQIVQCGLFALIRHVSSLSGGRRRGAQPGRHYPASAEARPSPGDGELLYVFKAVRSASDQPHPRSDGYLLRAGLGVPFVRQHGIEQRVSPAAVGKYVIAYAPLVCHPKVSRNRNGSLVFGAYRG